MKSSKLVISLIAGVAGGALLGILFAPDKGYETRRRLGEKADNLGVNVKENLQNFIENIAYKCKKVKEEAGDFSEDADEPSALINKKIPHFLKTGHEEIHI